MARLFHRAVVGAGLVTLVLGACAPGDDGDESAESQETPESTGEPAEIEDFDRTLRVSAWDAVGTLGLWVPSAPGLHFGAQLGLVRGTFKTYQVHIFSTFNQGEFTEFRDGEWKGTGVVLGAFTGYEQPLPAGLTLTSRMGYRYRKIGIRCSLRNDVFHLEGTAKPGTSTYLIYGGWLPPRIDVIASTPTISFQEMVKRLKRIERAGR